jgi:hypothetical protein
MEDPQNLCLDFENPHLEISIQLKALIKKDILKKPLQRTYLENHMVL